MPRYEHAGKFWTIELTGKQYTTQFGKLGSSGQTRLKKFATANEARAGFLIAVSAKEKEGYVDVAKRAKAKPKSAIAGNASLEAAIDADPYDKDAYAVYADALQVAGDPRGELIALQLRNKHAAAAQLLAKHAEYFLGPLAVHTKAYDHTYDEKQRVQVRRDAFTWKYGFIHALRLSHNNYAVPSSKPAYKLERTLAKAVLAPLLAHPSGRFLAEIAFQFNGEPSGNLQDLIDVLAKHAPPTIRSLHFGDYLFASGHAAGLFGHDTEISWYSVGNLGKLWKKVPGLRRLITQGGSKDRALGGGMQLGAIDLPNLVHAEFRTGGLEQANARAIAKAKIPKIEHLDVWYGDSDYGGDATLKDVQLLLDRTDLPALRHLGIRNTAFTDELIPRLAASKLIGRLTELDLSLGCLSDQGANQILAHRAAFAKLDRLDVSHNNLDHNGQVALKKQFGKKLVNRGQREADPELLRYPAIGE